MAYGSETEIRYLYTYGWTEDESSLCKLEQRALFGFDTGSRILESQIQVSPSRSPFIKERISVLYEADSLEGIIRQVKAMKLVESTFKVLFIKNYDQLPEEKVGFEERRAIARKVGSHIQGEPDLIQPDILFGIIRANDRWIFGEYEKNQAVWLHHQKKPQSYSTALSTRVARAVVNIAVPKIEGISAIDPCCGMGTVLVEARSMGVEITGSDFNRLAVFGARENLAHFGLEAEVEWRDIQDVQTGYDAAIIDMPYNICCSATPEEERHIIEQAHRIAKKVVFVTVEQIDRLVTQAGFQIVDRGVAKKGTFLRHIIVCEVS